jgi:hypothetical protein
MAADPAAPPEVVAGAAVREDTAVMAAAAGIFILHQKEATPR